MVYTLYGVGNREINEDSFNYVEGKVISVYLVADGCGGSASGEIASKMAVEFLVDKLNTKKVSEKYIRDCLTACNDFILSQQSKYGSMKATILGLIRTKRGCFAFNVGDSRLYQVRDGAIIFNTEDHAVPYVLYKAGIIEKNEINTHEDRNKLLEALGARSEIKINVYQLDVKKEDLFLMATDGFWEHFYDKDFKECLPNTAEEWLKNAERCILDANDPEQDNYTVLLIGDING